jgi:hypothetical protein
MNYIEAKRKQVQLRAELRAVGQLICGLEDQHLMVSYVEWGHSGKECSRCGLRIKERSHYKPL